jgi:hypothetical protein
MSYFSDCLVYLKFVKRLQNFMPLTMTFFKQFCEQKMSAMFEKKFRMRQILGPLTRIFSYSYAREK